MVDLKRIEAKLDKALAKETKESLTAWLTHKRAKRAIVKHDTPKDTLKRGIL